MAPGPGFEPRLPGPAPGVLPLDDPGIIGLYYITLPISLQPLLRLFLAHGILQVQKQK